VWGKGFWLGEVVGAEVVGSCGCGCGSGWLWLWFVRREGVWSGEVVVGAEVVVGVVVEEGGLVGRSCRGGRGCGSCGCERSSWGQRLWVRDGLLK